MRVLLIILCVFAFGLNTGCDKIKNSIKKGRDYFKSEETKSNSPKKDKKGTADIPPRARYSKEEDELSPNPPPEPPSEDDLIYTTNNDGFINEPITYREMKSGDYAIAIQKFNKKTNCENYSRQLRRERINNFIYFDKESKKYMVMTGNYISESQAEKGLTHLYKMGYMESEIYAEK